MANETLYTSIGATMRANIIEDATFVAIQETIMPSLVTVRTDNMGMAPRILGTYAQFTAGTASEGAALGTYSELTKSASGTLTPSIKQAESFFSDERQLSDPQNAQQDVAIELGRALGKKLDSDLVDQFASFTARKGHGGSAVTLNYVAAAVAVLRNNNTPNPVNVVLHPYHWHDIWTALGNPAATQAFQGEVATQALRDYYVGSFLGASWFIDANIGTAAGSGTAYSGVFHADAIMLDSRTPIEIELERSALKRGFDIVGHMRYSTGVYKNEHGAAVAGDITEPA